MNAWRQSVEWVRGEFFAFSIVAAYRAQYEQELGGFQETPNAAAPEASKSTTSPHWNSPEDLMDSEAFFSVEENLADHENCPDQDFQSSFQTIRQTP